MTKICFLDIDGVLNDYPNFFLNWAEKHHKVHWPNIISAKKSLIYRRVKDEFYECNGLGLAVPRKNIEYFNQALKQKKYKVVVLTSRPDSKKIREDTKNWLNKKIEYEALVFTKHKAFEIQKNSSNASSVIYIEDDIRYIKQLSEIKRIKCNFTVLHLFKQPQTMNLPNWVKYHSMPVFDDIIDFINNGG